MFDGKFYTYWKNRMEIFIKAENYQVWRVIKIGDFEVTTTNTSNEIIPKHITEYEKEDFQKMKMNALAIKLLYCGLGPNKHNYGLQICQADLGSAGSYPRGYQ